MKKFIYFIFVIILATSANAGENIQIPFSSGYKYQQTLSNQIEKTNMDFLVDNSQYFTEPQEIVGKKPVGLVFLMSLVLPGSGEYYMGNKVQSVIFLTSEVLLWTGLTANSMYAEHLLEESYTYAAQHANVSRSGKDKQYWIDIGKFDSIYDFNEERRRDRLFDAVYLNEEEKYWFWDGRDKRFKYDGMRLDANEISGQDVYFYASIVLNHLVSAVNALRLARGHNRELAEKVDWSLKFNSYKLEDKPFYGIKFSTQF